MVRRSVQVPDRSTFQGLTPNKDKDKKVNLVRHKSSTVGPKVGVPHSLALIRRPRRFEGAWKSLYSYNRGNRSWRSIISTYTVTQKVGHKWARCQGIFFLFWPVALFELFWMRDTKFGSSQFQSKGSSSLYWSKRYGEMKDPKSMNCTWILVPNLYPTLKTPKTLSPQSSAICKFPCRSSA